MANENLKGFIFIRKRSVEMLVLLAAQYLLGMYVALFALSPDDPGYSKESVLPKIIFGVHGLLGLFLLIGSIIVMIAGVRSGNLKIKRKSIFGFLSILLAFVAGIATITFKDNASEISSYIMSLGFLLSFFFYGKLLYILKKS